MTRRTLAFFFAHLPVLARDYGRDSGWRRFGGQRRSEIDIVDRTLSDLRSVASRNYVDRHERNHFQGAMDDLHRFRYNWSRGGRFDIGRLKSAIGHIADLAQARQIHPRDRQILARNLQALRELRSMRGGSGWR